MSENGPEFPMVNSSSRVVQSVALFFASLMQNRLAEAAKFLRPPGWYKRRFKGEEQRAKNFTISENPIVCMVRRRQKAAAFMDIPEARKIPQAKRDARRNPLQLVPAPSVRPEALDRRLAFLLSDAVVKQQLAASVLPGQTPYQAELFVWERQMREVRKIYRAQYLQALQATTIEEAERERAASQVELKERKEKKQEKLEKKAIELKRQAVLADQKRINSKVEEALEVGRRIRTKTQKLSWLDGLADPAAVSLAEPTQLDSPDREISWTRLARQLSAVKSGPEKNRRIHVTQNVYRQILERSFDVLPENEEYRNVRKYPTIFPENDLARVKEEVAKVESIPEAQTRAPATPLSPEERADLYYVGFSPEEKLELVEKKIEMLEQRVKAEEALGGTDTLTLQLLDLLTAAKAARLEEETAQRVKARQERDDFV